jgi:hypothetical protein
VADMPNDPNLERRMSRFENETVAIYELIDDFRSETQTRFDRIDDFRRETQTRFDRIESTLGEVLQRLPEPS